MSQWMRWGGDATEGLGWARFFGWASVGIGVITTLACFLVPHEGQDGRTAWLVLFGSAAVWLGGMSASRYRSLGRRRVALPIVGIALGCLTIAVMIYAFTVLVLASYGIAWPAPAIWLAPAGVDVPQAPPGVPS
jgi:hypothetical protein